MYKHLQYRATKHQRAIPSPSRQSGLLSFSPPAVAISSRLRREGPSPACKQPRIGAPLSQHMPTTHTPTIPILKSVGIPAFLSSCTCAWHQAYIARSTLRSTCCGKPHMMHHIPLPAIHATINFEAAPATCRNGVGPHAVSCNAPPRP
jgi:hypothetical protein